VHGLGAIRRRNRRNNKRGVMRQLTVSQSAYSTFLFPQFANATAESESEFEVALRTLKKLKDPALTLEKELSPQEAEARKSGTPVFAFRKLLEESATFLLETDEHALLLKRVKANKTLVVFVALEEFNALLEMVEKAPEFKPELVERTEK